MSPLTNEEILMMLNQLAGKIQSSHGEISALSTKSKKSTSVAQDRRNYFIYTSKKLEQRTFTEVLLKIINTNFLGERGVSPLSSAVFLGFLSCGLTK